jgi:hypothetical protein
MRGRIITECPAIALLLLAAWGTGSAVAYPADALAALFPKTGVLLGVFAEPKTNTAEQAIGMLETEIGRPFYLDHQYYIWMDAIPTAYESWTVSRGRIPFVAWKPKNTNGTPYRWSTITNGDWDTWIGQRADAFNQFAQLTLMTFHHEPETDQDTPGVTNYGTALEYQAAFRYVVNIFRNHGVSNVVWAVVLTQPSYTNPATGGRMQADRWYPGDDVVDVIGSDGYNWYPTKTNSVWSSFSNVFSGFYAWGANHSKPLLIGEFGCMEDPAVTNAKADWFMAIPAVLQQWPAIKDICYFNHHDPVYPWNLDSSPAALSGFQNMASNAWLFPPRPVLLDCLFSAGQAQLQISGCVGSPCRIEFSDSLENPNWTTLTNFTLTNTPCVFVDSNSVGSVSTRFYRCQ